MCTHISLCVNGSFMKFGNRTSQETVAYVRFHGFGHWALEWSRPATPSTSLIYGFYMRRMCRKIQFA